MIPFAKPSFSAEQMMAASVNKGTNERQKKIQVLKVRTGKIGVRVTRIRK